MNKEQTCPNCSVVNTVAGIFQDSFGNDRGGAEPPTLTCYNCSTKFQGKESYKTVLETDTNVPKRHTH